MIDRHGSESLDTPSANVNDHTGSWKQEPIAIIGLSCIFPQASDEKQFWSNLRRGIDAITEVPSSHWDPQDYYDPDPKRPDKTYARRGGFLTPIPFDPLEFGIAPSNLEAIDTSQLLGLVAAKRALENAGYGPAGRPVDDLRISCILGVTGTLELVIPLGARLGHPRWRRALLESGISPALAEQIVQRIAASYVPWQENSFPGLLGNVVAGRVANRMNLKGTNCVVDAACASSLSALYMGCLELWSGRAEMVLSGGVDTFNDIFMYMCFSKTPALSPTGDARPFADQGDGTILGEGLGMLVLKRYSDALRDRDQIRALILGIGTSSDGAGQAVYAPSKEGQIRCLYNAYQMTGVSPATVELLEAHGTGTRVGDATELAGLIEVFRQSGRKGRWCALGSVKSQIGHTKAAAGVAGLIKAILALNHRVLPPSIKVEKPLPPLLESDCPFYLNREARPWITPLDHPRRAGVSAFGFGGSNYHCIVEESPTSRVRNAATISPPDVQEKISVQTRVEAQGRWCAERETPLPDWDDDVLFWAWSAQTPGELLHQVEKCEEIVNQALSREFVMRRLRRYTASLRDEFSSSKSERLLLVVRSPSAFPHAVSSIRRHWFRAEHFWHIVEEDYAIYRGRGEQPGKLAFLFPGQGSQRVNMLKELMCRCPVMQEVLGDADRVFQRELSESTPSSPTHDAGTPPRLSEIIYPPPAWTAQERDQQENLLRQTHIAQPAIGAVSLGLAAVLETFRVVPDLTAGHSYGELTALCVARRIAPISLIRLSWLRGYLMKHLQTEDGGMLAVGVEPHVVEPLIREAQLNVVVANRNSPQQLVLSGRLADIERAEDLFRQRKIISKRLAVSGAFHSPLQASARQHFRLRLEAETILPSSMVVVYANALANCYPEEPGAVRELLARQITEPVDWVKQIQNMYAAGARIFLEVGPGQVLSGLTRSILEGKSHWSWSIESGSRLDTGMFELARTLAHLASLGCTIDLSKWDPDPPAPLDPPSGRLCIPLCGANYVRPRTTTLSPKDEQTGTTSTDFQLPQPHQMIPDAMRDHSMPQQIVKANPHLPADHTPSLVPAEHVTSPRRFQSEQHPHHNPEILASMIRTHEPGDPTALSQAASRPVSQSIHLNVVSEHLQSTSQILQLFTDIHQQTAQLHQQYLQGQQRLLDTLEVLLRPTNSAWSAQSSRPTPPTHTPDSSGIDQPSSPICSENTSTTLIFSPPTPRQHAQVPQSPSNLQARVQRNGQGKAEPRTPLQVSQLDSASSHTATRLYEESTPPKLSESVTPLPSTERESSSLQKLVLEVVSEKTGYPQEMLQPQMTLDHDLGIDSIKRVEIMSALQERHPALAHLESGQLQTLHSLKDIIDLIQSGERRQGNHTTYERPSIPDVPATSNSTDSRALSQANSRELTELLLAIVAEKTGYPRDMLQLEMTLDHDLGIDSIKRVEILSALQERCPHLPAITQEHMQTLHRLGDIVRCLQPECTSCASPQTTLDQTVLDASSQIVGGCLDSGESHAAPRLLRGILRRHPWDPCNHIFPFRPDASAWVVTECSTALTDCISRTLREWGLQIHILSPLEALQAPLAEHTVGMVWFPPSSGTDAKTLEAALQVLQRVGPVLRTNAQQNHLCFLIGFTHLDGCFGFDPASSDLHDTQSAGVAGLLKTARLEWPELHVRVIDLHQPDLLTRQTTTRPILNVLFSPGPVEVGVTAEGIWQLQSSFEAISLDEGNTEPQLSQSDVILITGGARGITTAVIHELAQYGPAKFFICGRTVLPTPEEYTIWKDCSDQQLIRQLSDQHPAWSLRQCQQRLSEIRASCQVHETLTQLRSSGVDASYQSIDVRNAQAIESWLNLARRAGRIRGIIHAAGVLADRRLEEKTIEDLQRVYGPKVCGWTNLSNYLPWNDLEWVVIYSSFTARYGRIGQADYALANEILNKEAQRWQRRYPHCRIVSFNWGPWDGGMVQGSLKQLFAHEGISLIPLRTGARLVTHELYRSTSREVEILVLGPDSTTPDVLQTLPASTEHRDQTTTMLPSLSESNSTIRSQGHERRFKPVLNREIQVRDCPWLMSHVIGGRAVFPVAMMIDWMLEAVVKSQPGLSVLGLNHLHVYHGIKCRLEERLSLSISCSRPLRESHKMLMVECLLHASQQGPRKPYASAVIILGDPVDELTPSVTIPSLRSKEEANRSPHLLIGMSRDEVYQHLFHGPAWQTIQHVDELGDQHIQLRAIPSPHSWAWNAEGQNQSWRLNPGLIDAALQAPILWCWRHWRKYCLPMAIKTVNIVGKPPTQFPATIHCYVEHVRSQELRFAAVIENDHHNHWVEMHGITFIADEQLASAFRHNELR